MTGRITAFLDQAGWKGAKVAPLAGDASSRRYARASLEGKSAIVMIAPPADRAAFDAFLDIAGRLRALGLSAPEILAAAPDDGLMLLEDLGDRSFAGLATPGAAKEAAIDVLVHLASAGGTWPVPHLIPAKMAEMTAIALPEGADHALQVMQAHFATHFTAPLVPALRDFHAENLIWLPGRSGLARVGLLDFQDAVMAPPGYDLTSLTHDARRDMDAGTQAVLTARYADAFGLEARAFATQCALLIFQRNLRILGVFQRLATARGKPGYLTHLPRVYAHIEGALRHPDLKDLTRAMAPMMAEIAP